MKQKLLALALCLTLLLSLAAPLVSAVPAEDDKRIFANYGAVTVDGDLGEDAMQLDSRSTSHKASFGAVWNKSYLYIGMTGIVASAYGDWQGSAKGSVDASLSPLASAYVYTDEHTYSVDANGAVSGNATVARSASTKVTYNNGSATGVFGVEFAIPMNEIDFYTLADGSVGASVKLSYVDTANNWHNFIGTVILCDQTVVVGRDIAGKHSAYSTNADQTMYERVNNGQIVSRALDDGVQAVNTYLPAAARSDADKIASGSTAYLFTTGLATNTETVAQEDLYLTGLPVADLSQVVAERAVAQKWANAQFESNTQNPARVILTVGFGSGNYVANTNGYVIYNTSDGLYLLNDTATHSVRLGAYLGSWFTLRLQISSDRSTKVTVNGTTVGSLPAPSASVAYGAAPLYANGLQSHLTAGNSISGTGAQELAQMTVRNAHVSRADATATAELKAISTYRIPKMIGMQTTAVAGNAYSIRFLAEVGRDLDSYDAVGYDYTVINAQGKRATDTASMTRVYETVMSGSSSAAAPNGGYIAAFALRNIPTANGEAMIYSVTPWALTANGVKLTGKPQTAVCVNKNGVIEFGNALDALTPESIFGTGYKMSGNSYIASRDLNLPASVNGFAGEITWSTDAPELIAPDGKLTRPIGGEAYCTLTATLKNGGTELGTKSFSITIRPLTVLWVEKDTDPKTGVGVVNASTGTLVIDGAYNSIIMDLGESTSLNRAVLRSVNGQTRLTRNFVALYASNDNATYTLIPSFAMQQVGNDIYFYNFDVEARYLKLHFTYNTEPDAATAIKNTLSNAMLAYWSEDPLLANAADFSGSKTLTVTNGSSEIAYDVIKTYTLADLGLTASDLKADFSDIRFRAGGKELPHYYVNNRFYVRVWEIPASGSVTVTVLYGNESAGNVSNGTAALEIEYGTKYSERRPAGQGVGWRNTVGLMPNGSLLRIGTYVKDENGSGSYDANEYALSWERSTNGGHTWTAPNIISGTRGAITGGGGLVIDYENNVVFFLAYTSGDNSIRSTLLKSTDSGQTWTITELTFDSVLTYSDGIKLSTADGAGPNVDYVFPIIKRNYEANTTTAWACLASSLYSADGGNTWTVSESSLQYGEFPVGNDGNISTYWTQHESGVSESTVWEQANGTLIMYSRYQGRLNGDNTVNRFVVSYSYDHGVTWTPTKLSTVHTTETQPIIDQYGDVALLMWGGNNEQGFRSYDRFPLNVAYSVDDAERFIGMLNVVYQTEMDSRTEHRKDNEAHINITNPDIAIASRDGVDYAYIVTDTHFILIENFKDFLYKTKGGFDSFEGGSLTADGWVTVSGTRTYDDTHYVAGIAPTIGTTGATEGSYAMQLGDQTEVSRSVPYVTKGEIFFDLYATSLSGGYTLELQSAYTRSSPTKASPVRIYIDSSGEVYCYNASNQKVSTGLKVNTGAANTLSVSFNGASNTATLTVNGASASITFHTGIDSYICFVHMRNGAGSNVSIDRFGLVDLD